MATTSNHTMSLHDPRRVPLLANGTSPGSTAVNPFDAPEFQEDFVLIAERLRQRLDEDYSIFSPREADDGAPVVDQWLEHYQERFLTYLPELFFEQYPGLRGDYQSQTGDLSRQLLRLIQEDLRRYALRRLAIHWSANKYPNSAGLGEPERHGENFVIPVYALRDNRPLGQVFVSETGVVSTEKSSTRLDVRKAITNAS